MKHASELFPDVARQLIAIGEKAWKQANSTLENIEEELREARFHNDTESIEYFLKEKRETHALLTQLEKETA